MAKNAVHQREKKNAVNCEMKEFSEGVNVVKHVMVEFVDDLELFDLLVEMVEHLVLEQKIKENHAIRNLAVSFFL